MTQASVVVSKSEFLHGIRTVERATSQLLIPYLYRVRMTTEGQGVRLFATDMLMGMTKWIPAVVTTGQLDLTIPLRELQAGIRKLPSGNILITQAENTDSIAIHSGRYDLRIKGASIQDFPSMPMVRSKATPRQVTIQWNARILQDISAKVAIAAATEDSRPVLTGVRVEIHQERATFVAADGFRMAIYETNLDRPIGEHTSFIVSAKTIKEVARLSAEQSEPPRFIYSPETSGIFWKLGSAEVMARPIQGAFPEYRELIPASCNTRVVVSCSELIGALEFLSETGIHTSSILKLQFDAESKRAYVLGAVQDSDEAPIGIIRAQVEISVIEMIGKSARIAINQYYLGTALDALGSDTKAMTIELTNDASPLVIRPAIESSDHSYLQVIMPMFVQWEEDEQLG
ncbi:MAG: DNA polymerase III subunit beta [Chloroflexi bacterium]|nr:DNA polymerase III subunit beta [Chloroflexota bacterium]